MDYDTRRYLHIYNLVLQKKLCNHYRYSDIHKYQDTLYKLFLLCGNRNPKEFVRYIPYCLELVKLMDGNLDLIDNQLLEFITIKRLAPPIYFSDLLKLIFFPERINDIGEYLDLMFGLFNDHNSDINLYYFKYQKFNDFYSYYYNNNFCNLKSEDRDIVITILAYIYRNNINNYEMVEKYLSDRDYYQEKIALYGIHLNRLFSRTNYYNIQFTNFYNSIERIFASPKIIIK